MYWSKLFIPTLREGSRLLERAGYMRALGSGSYLFLGRRSFDRIARIAREELNSIGAQEMLLPEGEAMADLARELRSHKQLPQIWYQVRSTLEACSFDASLEDLTERHASISQAFQSILRRCGVEFQVSGSFWGAKFTDPEGDLTPEPFHTPSCKTIAQLVEFTGFPEASHIKSLVMVAGETPVMVLLRGDHQMSEDKLKRLLGVAELRPAHAVEIHGLLGASPGSLGPVGLSGIRILADQALHGRSNMIAGANKDDYHLRHVTPGKDFAVKFFDLRRAEEGKRSTLEGETLFSNHGPANRATELAWLAHDPFAEPHHQGRYGIALDRILWAAAEQHQDQDGLILPAAIAPFDVIVTPINFSAEAQRQAAIEITEELKAADLDVLLDDRDERPGVKFKDADLIGVPWRIVIGKKVEQGMVEIVESRSKQKTDVATLDVLGFLNRQR